MLRTILVPLDDSTLAEYALSYACAMARQTGAGILVLGVVQCAQTTGESASAPTMASREARESLEATRQRLTSQGLSMQTEIRQGDVAQAIVAAAAEHQVGMVVMATHVQASIGRLLHHAATERVLQQVRVPVLLLRAGGPQPASCSSPLQRILVGLDGTPFAETALAYLAGAEFADQAELLLVRAVPPVSRVFAPDPFGAEHARFAQDEEWLRAREYLAEAARRYLQRRPYRLAVPVAYPAKAILDVAARAEIDLIVLATHARTGFALGSVARHVLHHTSVPVLLLPGAEVAEAVPLADTAMGDREDRDTNAAQSADLPVDESMVAGQPPPALVLAALGV
jgi:nucleotide-binding universal stress UspA family protein